jgi:hypothetical protein
MDYDALERLVKLRDQGTLSDAEFAEQKRILFTGCETEEHVASTGGSRVSSSTRLQKISALSFATGLCAVVYSTFLYDTTISPLDAWSDYSSVTAESSIRDRASAIGEINDRIQRSKSGERIINFPRVETQRRIFSFGALLTLLGAIGLCVPLARRRH